MPVTIISVSQQEAFKAAELVVNKAREDGGNPIAVAIVDYAGRLVAFTAMDHVMPASIRLAQSKAYSAVMGKRDTINWASMPKAKDNIDFDMRNWTDEHFSGFTGGLIITAGDNVIGGIGVSGRKGIMDNTDTLMQDSELAACGKAFINELITKHGI